MKIIKRGWSNRLNNEDYKKRVDQQIEQYRNVPSMHVDLPSIGQYYKDVYVKPAVKEVFDVDNHYQFYFKFFKEALSKSGNKQLISLGAGDGEIEVQVAKLLTAEGIEFHFSLAEVSQIQLDRAQDKVEKEGLTDFFSYEQVDLNNWHPTKRYCGVMAHHSLHHIVELERVFDSVKDSLDGFFCTMDMIGRNGHMRWPEVLDLINRIWPLIPKAKRVHKVLNGFEELFYNHDCSSEGFEGIRAEDILPSLIERFGFHAFYAYGGIPDPFVGRGFGHHYDITDDWDRAFIDLVAYLNELLIDLDYVKPTQMYAVLTSDTSSTPRVIGRRDPIFCVRPKA